MALSLFSPLKLGRYELANRILLAPLTRCRATVGGHVPTELMKEYYAQRASGGLIITECTMITPLTSAFYTEPGAYTPEQLTAWKTITDAVHDKNGKIFLQIWHAGRAAHPDLNDGAGTVGPSAIAIEGDVHGPNGKVAHVVPREITLDEIPHLVQLYATAAKNAVDVAGFDGVEIHGANGYLIDQFLRDGSNKRTDAYGGSLENRARFAVDVITAVVGAIGADRVGIRLSPLNSYNSMIDSDPIALTEYLSKKFNEFNLAYLHLMRSDFFQAQKGDVVPVARANFKGPLIVNMGYTKDEANALIASGGADAVTFGSSFLANPDLPDRFAKGAELNAADPATFYTGGPKGYTDYPTLS
ncbi:12-oxophytodienoate reductase [Achlya hypogyna]|uniref:12-oxophytodienoate reductase n=1 Tax=Achlya hypogyna TaxID=1202772 RepID=A0A1V9YT95_ACHHY|nr:12-oxophytodienoate reductase [Achlya hypogyna]